MEGQQEQLGRLSQQKGVMLLYFYNDHCAPCLSLRPKVMSLLEDFNDVQKLMINTDAHPKLCASFGIFSAPVIIVLADGKEYRRFSKYISVNELSDSLSRLIELMT